MGGNIGCRRVPDDYLIRQAFRRRLKNGLNFLKIQK